MFKFTRVFEEKNKIVTFQLGINSGCFLVTYRRCVNSSAALRRPLPDSCFQILPDRELAWAQAHVIPSKLNTKPEWSYPKKTKSLICYTPLQVSFVSRQMRIHINIQVREYLITHVHLPA